tara:strand:- start:3 stop:953 length:951 start_codon:yes stop_codon:yes gene_type:complete
MSTKKNTKYEELLKVRGKISDLEAKIRALGKPSDYLNKQNYTNKVNTLKAELGTGVFGRKDINDHYQDLKAQEARLVKNVGSRYVSTRLNRLGELLIQDQLLKSTGSTRAQPKFSKQGGLGYKLNPFYDPREDPTSELTLKKKDDALETAANKQELLVAQGDEAFTNMREKEIANEEFRKTFTANNPFSNTVYDTDLINNQIGNYSKLIGQTLNAPVPNLQFSTDSALADSLKIPQNVQEVKNKTVETVEPLPTGDTANNKGRGIYGLEIKEWQKATKRERQIAKQLSNNNVNVAIRGDGKRRGDGLKVGGKKWGD